MAPTTALAQTVIIRFSRLFRSLFKDKRSSGKVEGPAVSPKAKASTTLPGKVEKVIHPHPHSGEAEKAQIAVEGADHLYREIRVPNRLVDEKGQKVKLKEGDEVDVKIEADSVVSHGSTNPEDPSTPPRRTPL
jgi:hypothetical protein